MNYSHLSPVILSFGVFFLQVLIVKPMIIHEKKFKDQVILNL